MESALADRQTPPPRFWRISSASVEKGCAGAAAFLGALALFGWLADWPALTRLGLHTIPMAPNTALGFLVLGGALAQPAATLNSPVGRSLVRSVAALVCVVALLRLCELLAPISLHTDRWFLEVRDERYDEFRTGQMAPQTASTLLIAGLAVLLRDWRVRHAAISETIGVLSLIVTALGFIFFLGYLYDVSILASEFSIPMALNTALASLFLGVALLASVSSAFTPLRLLSGPSVYARLLRAFLPFTALTVCIVAWLMYFVSQGETASAAALVSAALAVAAIFLVSFVCTHIAGVVGGDLDKAGQELQEAEKRSRDYAARLETLNASLERRVAERTAALEQSQDQLQAILDNTTAVVYLKDTESRFLLINTRFETLFHISRAQVVGKSNHDLFPKEWADAFRANDLKVLESKAPLEFEETVPQDDGIHIYISIKFPLFRGAGQVYGVCGISTDITERKRAEEKLRRQNLMLQEMASSEREAHDALRQAQSQMVQAEKLAALGQLVAGVAHEINNPLSYVINNVAVLQRDVGALRDLVTIYEGTTANLRESQPELYVRAKDLAERIDLPYTLRNLDGLMARSRDGLKRIQYIVKDLRDFARLDESDLQEVDLNAGISSTINIIQGQAKSEQVSLVLDLQPLPQVTCFPAKINQVVLNLVANAIDACPPGGKVTVGTRAQGKGVEIFVADTGCGIEPAIRDRIFDPFFTTKPQGKGTGLGLSISYGIVQAHGGSIDLETAPGAGTCFRVQLPLRCSNRQRYGF